MFRGWWVGIVSGISWRWLCVCFHSGSLVSCVGFVSAWEGGTTTWWAVWALWIVVVAWWRWSCVGELWDGRDCMVEMKLCGWACGWVVGEPWRPWVACGELCECMRGRYGCIGELCGGRGCMVEMKLCRWVVRWPWLHGGDEVVWVSMCDWGMTVGELNLVVVWRPSLVQLLVEWHKWQHLVVFFSILMLISEEKKTSWKMPKTSSPPSLRNQQALVHQFSRHKTSF